MDKLTAFVNVDGAWYGPDDDVPGEVAAKIQNPKVWASGSAPAAAEDEPAKVDDEVKEPPRGGPGSSADAWRTFMVAKEFEVPEGASAKDMQAAWDARNEG